MEGAKVWTVLPGSPADRAGIAAGDRLWRLDCRSTGDIVDYRIWEADVELPLLIQTGSGPYRRVTVHKSITEPLGVQFDPPTIAPVLRCRNRCVFCFIDQNPPGLRQSLYLKDDDYRLSFLYGNYITLNHLSEKDLRRIVKLQLSPLYVSVHSTDPQIRSKLYGNKQAARGLENLRRLAGSGIKIHAQMVLCPGYNLGDDLSKTVNDLWSLTGAVLSVALVPVGLTSHGRPPKLLRRLTPSEAMSVVEKIHPLQNKFLEKRGSRFVFLSDELYYLAGISFPPVEQYEGFPQLENGVGMARLFLEELPAIDNLLPAACLRPLKITLVTGKEAAPLLEKLKERLGAVINLEVEPVVIENRFFGPSVTVAGLLAGRDLLAGLKDILPGEAVFFPARMLREGKDRFLDDLTLNDLKISRPTSFLPVEGPLDFARKLNRFIEGRERQPQITRKQGGR